MSQEVQVQTPGDIPPPKPSRILRYAGFPNLYLSPIGTYYARYNVNCKKHWKSLRTDKLSVAKIRLRRLMSDVDTQRAAMLQTRWKPRQHETISQWTGVPREVWAYTVNAPKLFQRITGVYLLGLQGKLVYIGESENVARRITDHAFTNAERKDFDDVRVILTPEERPDFRERIEQLLIAWLQPPLNRKFAAGQISGDPRDEFLKIAIRLSFDKADSIE